MSFELLVTVKTVTAPAWPGDTLVAEPVASDTVRLILRSTTKLSDAVTAFCDTPPTW